MAVRTVEQAIVAPQRSTGKSLLSFDGLRAQCARSAKNATITSIRFT